VEQPKSPSDASAQGLQQVNNRIESGADPRAHAGISANRSNELLGVSDGERLESGAARAASGAHPELEAVGVLHGADDPLGGGHVTVSSTRRIRLRKMGLSVSGKRNKAAVYLSKNNGEYPCSRESFER
jgi:hypothetical protein